MKRAAFLLVAIGCVGLVAWQLAKPSAREAPGATDAGVVLAAAGAKSPPDAGPQRDAAVAEVPPKASDNEGDADDHTPTEDERAVERLGLIPKRCPAGAESLLDREAAAAVAGCSTGSAITGQAVGQCRLLLVQFTVLQVDDSSAALVAAGSAEALSLFPDGGLAGRHPVGTNWSVEGGGESFTATPTKRGLLVTTSHTSYVGEDGLMGGPEVTTTSRWLLSLDERCAFITPSLLGLWADPKTGERLDIAEGAGAGGEVAVRYTSSRSQEQVLTVRSYSPEVPALVVAFTGSDTYTLALDGGVLISTDERGRVQQFQFVR